MKEQIIYAPGISVESNGRLYTITHVLNLEVVLAKDIETGNMEQLSIKDLRLNVPSAVSGTGKSRELSLIDNDDWQAATQLFSFIKPLLFSGKGRKRVNEQAREAGTHPTTLYRKINLYEQTGLISALIPSKSDGGRRKSRLSHETEELVRSTIQEVYLTAQKRSVKKTYDELRRRFHHANLRPPHVNTLRNRIRALPEEERVARRHGRSTASEKFGAYPGHFPGADWPLAVVQMDHTLLDIILVDDLQRLPIGRPWITVAMDVFSRMVLGFYISFDPPGAMAVGLCLVHSILPKEKWLDKFSIGGEWPCWGLMQMIHADNAGEFRGQMLQRACEQYGIDIRWRPVKQPHYGGHIERLLGTFLSEIHSLPGTTFSNPEQRGEYDSDKKAALTLAELEKWLMTFIVGVYHQRTHSSLHTSPLKQYERGILGTGTSPGRGLPARILDEDRLRLDLMPFVERTIQEYGVVIDEVHYYGPVFRSYVNSLATDGSRKKSRFIFKRDPRDISAVYFYDPELKQYFTIPYRDIAHPPMSVWEFRAARRRLKEQGAKEINENLIFATYEQMREQERQAIQKTRSARRENQRRLAHQQIDKPSLTVAQNVEANPAPSREGQASKPVIAFEELEELEQSSSDEQAI